MYQINEIICNEEATAKVNSVANCDSLTVSTPHRFRFHYCNMHLH